MRLKLFYLILGCFSSAFSQDIFYENKDMKEIIADSVNWKGRTSITFSNIFDFYWDSTMFYNKEFQELRFLNTNPSEFPITLKMDKIYFSHCELKMNPFNAIAQNEIIDLEFYQTKLEDTIVKFSEGLELKRLSLNECNFSFFDLKELNKLRKLEILKLSYFVVNSTDSAIHLENLESLILSRCIIEDEKMINQLINSSKKHVTFILDYVTFNTNNLSFHFKNKMNTVEIDVFKPENIHLSILMEEDINSINIYADIDTASIFNPNDKKVLNFICRNLENIDISQISSSLNSISIYYPQDTIQKIELPSLENIYIACVNRDDFRFFKNICIPKKAKLN